MAKILKGEFLVKFLKSLLKSRAVESLAIFQPDWSSSSTFIKLGYNYENCFFFYEARDILCCEKNLLTKRPKSGAVEFNFFSIATRTPSFPFVPHFFPA